ncbi:hypothetical protein OPS25_03295 [Alteromonas ponticola]|uniref:KfrA N-terminal DNA-binding domain-containing protein n=1 Tax=Alteromonas aquimaris TaxID=2998417 RepID=A0ABT3P425_9ALTE|nr:hypothetical protein [Alteromonas aquimaris]MCW8107529.1 hypothetical protein [Alteromonas aquimaris]
MQELSIHHSLLTICKQLNEKGIKPTASMIRAKAPFQTSIADAITAVRAFQSGEEVVSERKSEVAASPAERIAQLEKRVAELEAVVARIEKRGPDKT